MDIIKELRAKKQLKHELEQEIRNLEAKCPHKFFKLELHESIAFEYTPYLICDDCKKNLDKLHSPEAVMKLYKEELTFLVEREITDEEIKIFYNLHPRGYNLEDLKDLA